ncbi:hypothetical protein YC2023_002464 [Brassica napus]
MARALSILTTSAFSYLFELLALPVCRGLVVGVRLLDGIQLWSHLPVFSVTILLLVGGGFWRRSFCRVGSCEIVVSAYMVCGFLKSLVLMVSARAYSCSMETLV